MTKIGAPFNKKPEVIIEEPIEEVVDEPEKVVETESEPEIEEQKTEPEKEIEDEEILDEGKAGEHFASMVSSLRKLKEDKINLSNEISELQKKLQNSEKKYKDEIKSIKDAIKTALSN